LIFLDTNVVSAMMRPEYDPVMDAFSQAQRIEDLYLPSIVIAETRYGIALLPAGKRRDGIERNF